MQPMLKTKKDDDDITPSAFYPTGKSPPQVGSFGKSPVFSSLLNSSKRDSGYGTDCSPASNTSQTKFMYDDTEPAELPEMDDLDSEVFEPINDVIHEEDESDDDTDKEVEELTEGGDDLTHSISQPIQIKRPSAPTPEEDGEGTGRDNSSDEDLFISAPFNHTRWSNMPRNKFRPIASRSVGTQTPSPTSQVINDAMGPYGSPGLLRGNQQCNHIMKFRDLFQIHHDVSTGENLIEIEDIYAYLSRAGDNLIKKNVVRGIRAFQGGSRSFLGKDCATFLGLLQYLCNHPKERGCKTLLNTIEKDIITDNKGIVPSSYELYKLIAKTKILRAGILFDELTLSEEDIPTLVVDHKSHFTDAEWKKISWFENDFAKSVELLFETSYEEVLNKKYSRFQTLISLSECCKNIHHSAKHQIRRNVNRIQLADKEGEVKLCAGQVHIASIIDNDIKTSTDLFCPNTIENAVCFDITSSSKRNTIWAVFLQSSPIECDFDDLCKRIFYLVKRKHNVYLEKIFLLDQVTASNYSSSDGSILRFYLRDDVETNRITSICRTWVAETLIDDTIDLQEELQCEQCFNRKTNNTPLGLETFDIVQEWYLELPIELQLILEQFLNIYSLKYKVKDFQEISHTKLERLYAVYDTLLNIFNRKYIGIFQKNNANKLLIEYKSVGSVFDVTTSAGVTPSLKYAEQKLKSEGKSDLCYYNTYLKENELQYEAFGGEQKTHVSLRKCHLILMLDNLVRLQYIADPDPGEHRSKQLCTLPITIQGLPIDSQVTEAWHLPECDGTFNCLCKESATIVDETASTLLTELRDEERESRNNFFNWMTFGNQLIWSNLPDDLLEQISVTQTSRPQYTHEVEGVDLEDETTVGDCDDDVGTDCQDEDIVAILGSVDIEGPDHPVNQTFSDEDDEISEVTSLEKSIDEMSILEHDIVKESSDTLQNRLKSFGFEKFKVPQLLCRHPPPAIGRDDDIEKIREILDDVLVKGGYEANKDKCLDRILCGPDNKIGKCLFQLMNRDSKYQTFLPEFPLLHLRKSKINILISAYKNAGLLEILQVMRGDEKNDWGNLISIQHIDVATKHVRRLAMAFHLAFLIAFTHFLPKDELQEFLSDMEAGDCVTTSVRWSNQFHCFLDYGSSQNSTFALHFDMMQHCNDIVAISFSERLGGETGYNLLLGAVKSSLLFSFVNGATSYAPYCTQLLYSHYTAGYFHQCMKKTLYTTPFKNSSKNFALDTKREMDHLDAVKGFRSGSNIDSITCRMSLIDSLNEASLSGIKQKQIAVDDNLGMDISETDLQHVYPAAALILRRGGLSLEESPVPFNVYSKVPLRLPSAILDASSVGAGKYLLNKYLQQQKLVKIRIGMETDIDGPKDLVNRVKRTKGVTIKRFQKARVVSLKTERQAKEDNRQKIVAKQSNIIDALSSENNACQAILRPDSSKPKVSKALGIPRALKNLVLSCCPSTPLENYISLNLPYVPNSVKQSTALCTMEFAGTKFKMGNVKSGIDYIQSVERNLQVLLTNSTIEKLVICEEKYSFTPDDFKACTREQRKAKKDTDISHLKSNDSILNESNFDRDAITKTTEGKKLVSIFLAKNIKKLNLGRNIDLIVDSELQSGPNCICEGMCQCEKGFSNPIECRFRINKDPELRIMEEIKQCKGEAEMAVGDWFIQLQDDLKPEQSYICYVTSGDIDAVCIHLYALGEKASRNIDGTFKNEVFVVLQKGVGKVDVYNVSAILRLLEEKYHDRHIGMKIVFSLCVGGNDFIPKLYGISHDTVLKEVIGNTYLRSNLFVSNSSKIILNIPMFLELIKLLYTPKRLRGKTITYTEVRALTIGKKEDNNQIGGFKTTHPRKWLPPSGVIEKLGILVQLQIQYMETVGDHNAALPDFIGSNVLVRNASGEIEYDFGEDSHFESICDLPTIVQRKSVPKRSLDNTPQHGARRKRPLLTSTPRSK